MTGEKGEPVDGLGPRSGAERAVVGLGLVALAGVVWALWLAFWPVPHGGNGGQESVALSCGAPALYRQDAFRESVEDRWDDDIAQTLAEECAAKVDGHVREAVGVAVVTVPVGALWLWADLVLRLRRPVPGDVGARHDDRGAGPGAAAVSRP